MTSKHNPIETDSDDTMSTFPNIAQQGTYVQSEPNQKSGENSTRPLNRDGNSTADGPKIQKKYQFLQVQSPQQFNDASTSSSGSIDKTLIRKYEPQKKDSFEIHTNSNSNSEKEKNEQGRTSVSTLSISMANLKTDENQPETRSRSRKRRRFVRKVVCPNCDLEVWTRSADIINCRKCGISYIQESNNSGNNDEPSFSRSPALLKPSSSTSRRVFLDMKCRVCNDKNVKYVVPGEVVTCNCGGTMVQDKK